MNSSTGQMLSIPLEHHELIATRRSVVFHDIINYLTTSHCCLVETTASFSVLIDEGGRSCRMEKLHNCRLSGLGQLKSRTLCCHGSRHDGIKRSHPDEKKGPWQKLLLTLGSTRQKRSLIMEMLSPHCSSQHANFGHPNMSTVESLQNR